MAEATGVNGPRSSPSRHFHFATIETTSSSATMCPNPTRCGTCRALAPQTRAYLKVSLRVRCTESHTSSILELLRTISASLKSGSTPFLLVKNSMGQIVAFSLSLLSKEQKIKIRTVLYRFALVEALSIFFQQRPEHPNRAHSS